MSYKSFIDAAEKRKLKEGKNKTTTIVIGGQTCYSLPGDEGQILSPTGYHFEAKFDKNGNIESVSLIEDKIYENK